MKRRVLRTASGTLVLGLRARGHEHSEALHGMKPPPFRIARDVLRGEVARLRCVASARGRFDLPRERVLGKRRVGRELARASIGALRFSWPTELLHQHAAERKGGE